MCVWLQVLLGEVLLSGEGDTLLSLQSLSGAVGMTGASTRPHLSSVYTERTVVGIGSNGHRLQLLFLMLSYARYVRGYGHSGHSLISEIIIAADAHSSLCPLLFARYRLNLFFLT